MRGEGTRPPLQSLPHIAQNFPRRVMSRRAGDAAAGMRAGAAHVKARDGAAIVGMAQHRPGGKNLPELEAAVKNIAADEAEFAFEIERG